MVMRDVRRLQIDHVGIARQGLSEIRILKRLQKAG